MNRKMYLLINIAVSCVTLFFLGKIMLNIYLWSLIGTIISWVWIIPATLFALISLLLKGIRMYIILMEKQVSANRFSRTYVKSTFVTLSLPYKLGEFFRIFSYGYDIKSYTSGFLSVIVDRYFDSMPLMFIIMLYLIFNQSIISLVTIIIITFTFLSTAIYVVYPSSSKYLNQFLITKTNSHRGIFALSWLDKVDVWYAKTSILVKGRTSLLFFISGISLSAEYFSLWSLARLLGQNFSRDDFFRHLNAAFVGSSYPITNSYLILGAMVFGILSLLVYGFRLVREGARHE